MASAVGQCLHLQQGAVDDECRGAIVLRQQLSFRPGRAYELSLTVALSPGNALDEVTPFGVSSWAADVEDTVRDIDGTDRNWLLNAWYSFTADLAGEDSLRATAGLIDGTEYLDNNAYSNDEHTQFMNAALVNRPNVFIPSYSPGLAVEWVAGVFTSSAVYMRAGRPDADSFDFYGLQLGYGARTRFGDGTTD